MTAGDQRSEGSAADVERGALKEAVVSILIVFFPLTGIFLIFPLDRLFGVAGQAIGVGLLFGSLIAGSLLYLSAGRGKLVKVSLSILAFALFMGFFYLVRSSRFYVDEALGLISVVAMPFISLSISRTLMRAFHPANHRAPAEGAQSEEGAEER